MTDFLQQIKYDIARKEKQVKQNKADKEMYLALIKKLDNDINALNNEISALKQKYNTFDTKSFVTDHATLRYLERTKIIDIKQLKENLLTPEVLNAIFIDADKVHSNGYSFVIKNGKIVTIIKDGEEEEQ